MAAAPDEDIPSRTPLPAGSRMTRWMRPSPWPPQYVRTTPGRSSSSLLYHRHLFLPPRCLRGLMRASPSSGRAQGRAGRRSPAVPLRAAGLRPEEAVPPHPASSLPPWPDAPRAVPVCSTLWSAMCCFVHACLWLRVASYLTGARVRFPGGLPCAVLFTLACGFELLRTLPSILWSTHLQMKHGWTSAIGCSYCFRWC